MAYDLYDKRYTVNEYERFYYYFCEVKWRQIRFFSILLHEEMKVQICLPIILNVIILFNLLRRLLLE